MNELHVVDTIVQLFFFLIILALVIGIISLIVMFIKRNKRLDRLEEKLDKVLSDKVNRDR